MITTKRKGEGKKKKKKKETTQNLSKNVLASKGLFVVASYAFPFSRGYCVCGQSFVSFPTRRR